jgi:secreted trypsin-like serine protease
MPRIPFGLAWVPYLALPSCPMTRALLALASWVLCCSQAAALVGGAPAAGDIARQIVLIVGSRGSFCTGMAVAPDLVLTAAHCVLPGAEYKLVEFDATRQPVFRDVVTIRRHPQFSWQALLAHRATADIALLKLAGPLPAAPRAVVLDNGRAVVGERFAVIGAGVTVRGDGQTGGIARLATLVATGQPGNLQIRLVDPATNGARAGLGACTGDSGAPVFRDGSSRDVLMGLVSWSTGPNGSAGCGGLTGVTPLSLYRRWVLDTARALGSKLP